MIKRNLYFIVFIFLILLVFLASLIPIRLYHWWDETSYLQNAEVIFSERDNYDEFSFRPPLLSIIIALGFYIWHSTIFASILVAIICMAAPVFIFLAAKKMYGLQVGFIASLLLALTNFFIYNSNSIMTDIPALSLLSISFYLTLLNNRQKALFVSCLLYTSPSPRDS